MLRAGYGHVRWPRIGIGRRQHHQRHCRGGQHQRLLPADGYLVGVGIAAETLAGNIKSVRDGHHARHARHFEFRGIRLRRRQYRGSHPPGAPFDGSENHPRCERRHEQGSARGIRLQAVAI